MAPMRGGIASAALIGAFTAIAGFAPMGSLSWADSPNGVSASSALLSDSDGDGVDDGQDCRPSDATTWSSSSEARSLGLQGGVATTFTWLAPLSPGGTADLYDLLRSTSVSDWSGATCLLPNGSSTSPAFTDGELPAGGGVFFYLTRAKSACGGVLGTSSSGIPISGPSCSVANGGACAAGAACEAGYCCSGLCRDVTSDVDNCGQCGTPCTNPAGTTQCLAGTCSPTCAPLNQSCDGDPNNGCETQVITPTNCGACGNVCPGYGQLNDNVACSGGQVCTFSCQGENYDVDGTPSNGCEIADSPTGNHTQGTAIAQASRSCNDGDTFSFGGTVPYDTRIHANPPVSNFNPTTGSAPDWLAIPATGGICVNDLSVTFTVSPLLSPTCFRLTVTTNAFSASCSASAAGTCSISRGSGAYADGTTVFFTVDRTCSVSVPGKVNYTIAGHL